LIAGRPPFDGDNIPQLVHRVVHEEPKSLEALDASLPRGIDEAVLRALKKSRDERYPSVAELATALAPFAPRHALLSVSRVSRMLSSKERRASEAGLANTEEAPRGSAPSTPMTWSSQQRQSRQRVGVGLALLIVAGVLAGLFFAFQAKKPELAEPSPRDAEPHIVTPAPAATARPTTVSEAAKEPPAAEPAAADAPAPSDTTAPVVAEQPTVQPAEPVEPATAEAPAEEREQAPAQRERAARKRADKPAAAAPTPQPAAPTTSPSAPSGVSDFGGRR
jgi:serine/threonine-protein kinase